MKNHLKSIAIGASILLLFLLGIGIAQAVQVTVTAAPGTGYILTSTSTGAWIPVQGNGVSGNCVKWGANNSLLDVGSPCSSGSGTNYFTNSGANTYLNTGTNLEAPTFTSTSTDPSFFNGATLYASSTNFATVFGKNADMEATTSSQLGNTAFGFQALELNQSDWNTAFGQGALASTTSGHFDTGFGDAPLELNQTGISDTAVGEAPLRNNISGSWDTAIGNDTMLDNTSGSFDTAYGAYALGLNTTGASSTAIGYLSGYNNTTGNNNTAYGFESLYSNQTGSGDIALGYGAGAWETGSNAFYVNNVAEANSAADKADSLLYGTFSGSAGSTAGQGLTINGTATTTGNFTLNSTGYVQGFFGPYDSSPASNVEVNCQSEGPYCGFGIKDNNGGGTFDGALFLDLTDEPSGIAQPLLLKNNTGYATCLAIEGSGYGCLNDYNTDATLWTVISPPYKSGGTEAGMTTTMLGASGNDNTDYGIQQYPAGGSPATGIDAYQNYYSTSYSQPLPEPDFSFYEQTNNNESGTAWHWLVATTTPTGAEGTTTSLCFGDVGSTTPSAFANCGVLASSPTVSVMSSSSRTTAFDVSKVTNNVFTHNFDVLNDGDVGIGTQSPTALLDILGDYPLFKVRNTDTAQYSGAGFDLINSNVSGGQAGYTFYAGINDVADTQGFLSLDETNASGAGTGHVMVVTGTSTIDFYPFVGIASTTPGSLLSVGNTNGINFSTATSTFSSTGGINIATGCFAINGTCLPTTNASSTLLSDNNTFSGATTTFTKNIAVSSGGDETIAPNLSFGVSANDWPFSISGGRAMGYYDGDWGITTGASHSQKFFVDGTNGTPGSGVEALYLYGNASSMPSLVGHVGISSTTPYAFLTVASNSSISAGTDSTPQFAVWPIGSSTPSLIVSSTNSLGNVGVGSSTPWAQFSQLAASSTVAFNPVNVISALMNTTTYILQEIDEWGHLITSGPAPTVTGGTSSVSGNDRNGTITVTGTALTSVTLTFAHAYAAAPDCTESDNSTVVTADITSISASQVVFGFSAGVSSGTIWYLCQGHQ